MLGCCRPWLSMYVNDCMFSRGFQNSVTSAVCCLKINAFFFKFVFILILILVRFLLSPKMSHLRRGQSCRTQTDLQPARGFNRQTGMRCKENITVIYSYQPWKEHVYQIALPAIHSHGGFLLFLGVVFFSNSMARGDTFTSSSNWSCKHWPLLWWTGAVVSVSIHLLAAKQDACVWESVSQQAPQRGRGS